MGLDGALPRSLTERRLREILGLTEQQMNRLAKALNARAADVWQAGGYSEQEFNSALVEFINTAAGLEQYQAAAREVEKRVPKWRLTINAGIFQNILERYLDDPEFRAIFPEGEATKIEPGDMDEIRRFLAEGEHWPQLAEFSWATALESGSTTFLKDSVESYADVAEELRDVLTSMGAEGSAVGAEPEPEAEAAAGATAGDDGHLQEADALLKSIRDHVRKVRLDAPDIGLLDDLAADVGKLRQLAADLKQERAVEILLGKFDDTAQKFAETLTMLEIGAKLDARRARMADRSDDPGEAEPWIDGLAVLLDLIDRLNRDIKELLDNISAAATGNDLDAIQQHTQAAQTKKADLEDKVGALKTHLSG
jgi:hypothetical protein